MKKSKIVIKTLDLKPKHKDEGQSEVLIGQSFSKRLWEGRFSKLCSGLKQNFTKKKKLK